MFSCLFIVIISGLLYDLKAQKKPMEEGIRALNFPENKETAVMDSIQTIFLPIDGMQENILQIKNISVGVMTIILKVKISQFETLRRTVKKLVDEILAEAEYQATHGGIEYEYAVTNLQSYIEFLNETTEEETLSTVNAKLLRTLSYMV